MSKKPNRTAIVSGGSNGIGKSIVKKLKDTNVLTLIADVTPPENLSDLEVFCTTDITKANDIKRLFDHFREYADAPDYLICNAGRGLLEKITEGDPEKWKSLFDLNVMGQLRLIRSFSEAMMQKGRGDIIIISSVAANHAHEYGGIYSASKAAMKMISETLRQEMPPQIRVTTITPGIVDTDFFNSMFSGKQSIDEIGWGALTPDDVANAVIYALQCPRHYVINDITLRPASQKM